MKRREIFKDTFVQKKINNVLFYRVFHQNLITVARTRMITLKLEKKFLKLFLQLLSIFLSCFIIKYIPYTCYRNAVRIGNSYKTRVSNCKRETIGKDSLIVTIRMHEEVICIARGCLGVFTKHFNLT